MPLLGVIRFLSRLARGTRQLKRRLRVLELIRAAPVPGPHLDRVTVAHLQAIAESRADKINLATYILEEREFGILFEGYVSRRGLSGSMQLRVYQ